MSNKFKYKNCNYKLSVYGSNYLTDCKDYIVCDVINFSGRKLIINCGNFKPYDYYHLVLSSNTKLSTINSIAHYSKSYKDCDIINDHNIITIKSNNIYIINNDITDSFTDIRTLDVIKSINRDLNFKMLLDEKLL